ncbi:MAG: EpsG family protein [Acutalibacteraceae bacterium]
MLVYWSILAWTGFVGLTWKKWFIVKTGIENGERYVRPTFVSLFCSFIPLIFITGMRTAGFGDTINYIAGFNQLEPTFNAMIHLNSKDKLFYIFETLIKMIYPHPNLWFLFVGAIQVLLVCLVLKEYSVMPGVSMFLFIASTEFTYMLNGMRQFVAVTICFAAFKFLEQKKYFWYIVVIIIAAQFHGTAYVMLIALAVSFIKPWSRTMYFVMAAFAVTIIFLNPVLEGMQIFFEDTKYESQMNELISTEGVNILRMFVALVPCVIGFVFRKNKQLWSERKWCLCMNLSLINAAFWIAASIVGGNLMARFAEYFTIYQLLTYPMLFKYCFKGNTRIVVVGMFSVLYIVWFWYQMAVNWEANYISSILGWYF